MKPWLQRRSKLGVQEIKLEDQEGYKNYLRMTEDNFLELLAIVKWDIEKQNTRTSDPISANFKLAATICFSSTGAFYTDFFRIH